MLSATLLSHVVIALVKLENLKAIHNGLAAVASFASVVIALVKLENLKAIHNFCLITVMVLCPEYGYRNKRSSS